MYNKAVRCTRSSSAQVCQGPMPQSFVSLAKTSCAGRGIIRYSVPPRRQLPDFNRAVLVGSGVRDRCSRRSRAQVEGKQGFAEMGSREGKVGEGVCVR